VIDAGGIDARSSKKASKPPTPLDGGWGALEKKRRDPFPGGDFAG